MQHKKHEAFGIALWVILLVYLLVYQRTDATRMIFIAIVSFAFCFVGSTLPDIDTVKSNAFRRMQFITAVITFTVSFVALSEVFGTSMAGVAYLIAASALITAAMLVIIRVVLPRHRGPIHSLAAGAVYGVITLVVSYVLLFDVWTSLLIAFFAFLSFASHLALDVVIK
ncbi:MAG: metal-dependent hydrolase [archaeon]